MKRLSQWYFRLAGWTIEGSIPDEPKSVAVGYPHTSNWDFFVFLAIIGHFRLKARFLAHQGLFIGPFGWLLDRWGAIPVQGGARNVVNTMVQEFEKADSLFLAIAPEGTRAGGAAWRSGFWRIADAADVPVVMGFVDRATKRMGLGPAVRIQGDPEAWMEKARVFYADKHGFKPRNRGPIELER